MQQHSNVEQVLNQAKRSLLGLAMRNDQSAGAKEAGILIKEVDAAKDGLKAAAAATTTRQVPEEASRPRDLVGSQGAALSKKV